jgi:hypothetical protein
MTDKKTPAEKKKGEQLSNMSIREALRPHAIRAVERLVELMESTNDNVALGASKEVIGRFIPTLKSTEITGKDGEKIPFTIILKK